MNHRLHCFLFLLGLSLAASPSATAGVVGTITAVSPDHREISLDGFTYRLPVEVRIVYQDRPGISLPASALRKGQAVHYDAERGSVSTLRLLDKPVSY